MTKCYIVLTMSAFRHFIFCLPNIPPKNFKPQLYAKTPYPCPFCCHIRHISANHKWWNHPTNARKISHAYPANPALRNALAGTSINQLATRADNPDQYDTHFSNEVPSRGITDQKALAAAGYLQAST